MKRHTPLLGLLVLVLTLTACGSSASDDRKRLPDIGLERLGQDGSYPVAGAGNERVLNLWATWCAPCRAELPAFDAVAATVDTVDIIGVNIGDTGDDAAALVEELDLSFPQVLDPRADIQRSLRISGLPATVFVDGNGDVLEIHNGELTEGELRELLMDLYGLDLELQ